MVIILVIVVAFARFKQEVTSQQLEDHACERPQVGACVVRVTEDGLRASVLSGLNLAREVVMSPTTIAHVDDSQVAVLVQGWPSLHLLAFIQLLSIQPRYSHFLNHISSWLFMLLAIFSQVSTTVGDRIR